ncbi:MAG: ABC transporter ATP-binding protein [Bacteroidales bacterium]|nr:ABC transporter ATP-binding protein [Bacteroidales bacterium]
MTQETAISIRNLSKEYYRIEKSGRFSRKPTKGTGFLAVNNISINIKKGEVICITGHNGSGKSTLLKMIAEVTLPTSGEIEINGKVASILEIGIGFQPEISGYENIFLSGAMYGLKKSEIEAKIDRIIDMFGFPEFINTPVKYYSSGMYMRLAFSIIVNIEADIYLFDEVTSVGDTEFRTKVIHEISRLKDKNATVLIVTHTPTLFSKISDRFLLFDKGTISVSESLNNLQGVGNIDNRLHISGDKLAQIKEIHTKNIDFDLTNLKINTPTSDLNAIFDNDIEVVATICYKSHEPISILLTICDIMGNIITSASTELMTGDTENTTITFEIPKGYLHPAPLSLGFEILDSNGKSVVSYPNVMNMPYMKNDSLSGYLNMPIKIMKGTAL